MDDCLFCKLGRKELPIYTIHEDEKFLVFLDAFPHVEGQTVIMLKEHIPSTFTGASEDILKEIIVLGQKTAKAMEKALNLDRVVQITEGMHTNHFHIKLFPVQDEENYNLTKLEVEHPTPKEIISEEEGNRVRDLIKAQL